MLKNSFNYFLGIWKPATPDAGMLWEAGHPYVAAGTVNYIKKIYILSLQSTVHIVCLKFLPVSVPV
jgi:hypothetical protein